MENRRILILKDGESKIESCEYPVRRKGEAIVKVKACGICGSDIPRIFQNRAYYYPIVLGHEFSGVIVDSENPELNGTRAGVFPVLPCGECEFCKRGFYANCLHYDYYGSRRNGGMQEYIAIKEENLVKLPENVSFEAGAMLEPVSVCLHAVKKAKIQAGENVVVYGAGTIGLLCASWTKRFGANAVYVVDIDEKKLEFAAKLGFNAYRGERVQAAFECSGAGACVNQAIECVDAFGRIVLVGNASENVTIPSCNHAKILRKQLTVYGSWNSDFSAESDDWKDSVKAIANGEIRPELLITHKFAFSEWPKAINAIKSKTFYNKIMMVPDNE